MVIPGEATVQKRNKPFTKCLLMNDKICSWLTGSGEERRQPHLWERRPQVSPVPEWGGNSGIAQQGGHVQLYRLCTAQQGWIIHITVHHSFRAAGRWSCCGTKGPLEVTSKVVRLKWVIITCQAFKTGPRIWWSPIHVNSDSYSCDLMFLMFMGRTSFSQTA